MRVLHQLLSRDDDDDDDDGDDDDDDDSTEEDFRMIQNILYIHYTCHKALNIFIHTPPCRWTRMTFQAAPRLVVV